MLLLPRAPGLPTSVDLVGAAKFNSVKEHGKEASARLEVGAEAQLDQRCR